MKHDVSIWLTVFLWYLSVPLCFLVALYIGAFEPPRQINLHAYFWMWAAQDLPIVIYAWRKLTGTL